LDARAFLKVLLNPFGLNTLTDCGRAVDAVLSLNLLVYPTHAWRRLDWNSATAHRTRFFRISLLVRNKRCGFAYAAI